jgi:hypothetical protein
MPIEQFDDMEVTFLPTSQATLRDEPVSDILIFDTSQHRRIDTGPGSYEVAHRPYLHI